MKWPRSLFERFEEWFFKIRRRNPFDVFSATINEAEKFKARVKSTACPNCKGKLVLGKFERGPKGWEADVKCEACNFTGVISQLCSVLSNMDSKGKARD